MSAIRVLMCDMPPMLQSMVREMLQAEPDIELVPPCVAGEFTAGEIDVLLVAQKDFADSEMTVGQVASLGASGIVAIGNGVKHATIVHFKRSDRDLAEDGRSAFTAAIREAFGSGWKH